MSKPLKVTEAKIQLDSSQSELTHYRIEIYPHPILRERFCYSLAVGGKIFDDGLDIDPYSHGEYISITAAHNAALQRLFAMRKL